MALEGRIVDFGVADILQLISQQQKTGVLIVDRKDDSIEVLFWNGMIISAHPIAKAEKELLGEKLVKSGLITVEQLERALNSQENNLQHLGEILVEMGFLGKNELDRIIRNQIYDTFSELFQWKEGSYAFEATTVNFNEKVFTPLGLEHIILDVLRMMDEWPDIMKGISSMEAIYKQSVRTVSGEVDDTNSTMSHEEKIVYNLLDGQNTVQDVVDKSLLGKYTASKNLKNLLDNEYIEIVPYDTQVALKNKLRDYVLGKQVATLGSYAILLLLVMSLISLSPPDMKSTFGFFINRFNPAVSSFTDYEQTQVIKIKNALRIYLWENGRYPDKLNDLVVTNILKRNEITKDKGALYNYSAHGLSYSLN